MSIIRKSGKAFVEQGWRKDAAGHEQALVQETTNQGQDSGELFWNQAAGLGIIHVGLLEALREVFLSVSGASGHMAVC